MADRTGTVADIADAELLRRAVVSAIRTKGRAAPWVKVMDAFLLGSTYAHQLCRRFGIDPDTGEQQPPPNANSAPSAPHNSGDESSTD